MAFLEERERKLRVLARIGERLNAQNITWALGASALLYLKGLVPDFSDLDIMIKEEDAQRAQGVFAALGHQLPAEQRPGFKTRYYRAFQIEGVAVDVMAGFTILFQGEEHYFPLKKEAITDYHELGGVLIPLQSLGEWRKYYELMGRWNKVEIIDRRRPPVS
ncbi:MAG: hypothetical protein GX540_04685 [Clostridiales bacterium]|nr:hypothetical protein [Clostridiales bacterium]